MYVMFYDDTPKKATIDKITEAVAVYERRFGIRPDTCLVNEAELCDVPGLTVRAETRIRRNNYHLGTEGI